MSLQVTVKLKLSKQNKRIIVKYNTFEKATFDQYLLTSLAIHTPSNDDAMQYIDEITGNGSLNSHFKKMYLDIVKLSSEQKQNIMKSSKYPVLKIDESNKYVFYPELNISIYRGKIYTGDIEELEYTELLQLLYMQEEVIDLSIFTSSENNKADLYTVKIENNTKIAVCMHNKDIDINPELFQELLVVDLNSLDKYQGEIHSVVTEERWALLTNLVIHNLFSNECYFYDENGNHLQIRNSNIRKTEIAQISGLYIYHESYLNYEESAELALKVLEVIREELLFSKFNTCFYLKLFKVLPIDKVIDCINIYYKENKLPHEIAMFILQKLKSGVLLNWDRNILQNTLKYAKQDEYQFIYQADNGVQFDVNQLLCIDKILLTEQDRQKVEEYICNLNAKKESIKNIIGEITMKGLRERAKDLQADNITKKFSKLCNTYIGHFDKNLETIDLHEVEKILKEAQGFKEISVEIERRLFELDSKKQNK